MVRTCILCGCLCLTGVRISGQMLCCGCETALLNKSSAVYPEFLSLYDHNALLPTQKESRHAVFSSTGSRFR